MRMQEPATGPEWLVAILGRLLSFPGFHSASVQLILAALAHEADRVYPMTSGQSVWKNWPSGLSVRS